MGAPVILVTMLKSACEIGSSHWLCRCNTQSFWICLPCGNQIFSHIKVKSRSSHYISVSMMEGSLDTQKEREHHSQIRWGFNIKIKHQDSKNEEKSDSDNIPDDNSTFTITEKENLQKLLPKLISPPGISAVPKRVGTASNINMKASKWHSLFSKNLPLVALKVFGNVWSAGNRKQNISLLKNLCSLVECTHFVKCKSITEETCAKFEINYALYLGLLRHFLRGSPSDQITITLFALFKRVASKCNGQG
ncbi:hypothetical protein VP01_2127g2 [Puccinia sorghi]|uniref:Uncharacterized protein n=1 Tax=Puccinia sorghi TaxID=27349 RepID=A0A0L6VA20_9BASI|nr:hypothetical protein VP01_2127g2 [Puccinia sorghi]